MNNEYQAYDEKTKMRVQMALIEADEAAAHFGESPEPLDRSEASKHLMELYRWPSECGIISPGQVAMKIKQCFRRNEDTIKKGVEYEHYIGRKLAAGHPPEVLEASMKEHQTYWADREASMSSRGM